MHSSTGNHLHRVIRENKVCQGWWRDLEVMPYFRYNAPSGKVVCRFVGVLNGELQGVRDRKWNLERSIVFQIGILQLSQHFTASQVIQRSIKKRLD